MDFSSFFENTLYLKEALNNCSIQIRLYLIYLLSEIKDKMTVMSHKITWTHPLRYFRVHKTSALAL